MFVTTRAGVSMPRMIYGTAWKKDRTKDLVIKAVNAGFRGIDTACQPRHYREDLVGDAIQHLISLKTIGRTDIFLQTKYTPVGGQDPNSIPYNPRDPLETQVKTSVEKSLSNLKTDFIDSLLIHSPLRMEEGGMNGTLSVWKTLEQFVKQGKIKQIGLSNFYDLSDIKKVWEFAEIKPAIIQNRFYKDSGYDVGIRGFCATNQIFYQSFWTLTANPHVIASSLVKKNSKRTWKNSRTNILPFPHENGNRAIVRYNE